MMRYFESPTPTLHRWEREFMESSSYARSQYTMKNILKAQAFCQPIAG